MTVVSRSWRATRNGQRLRHGPMMSSSDKFWRATLSCQAGVSDCGGFAAHNADPAVQAGIERVKLRLVIWKNSAHAHSQGSESEPRAAP